MHIPKKNIKWAIKRYTCVSLIKMFIVCLFVFFKHAVWKKYDYTFVSSLAVKRSYIRMSTVIYSAKMFCRLKFLRKFV